MAAQSVRLRKVPVESDIEELFKELTASIPKLVIDIDQYHLENEPFATGGFAEVFKAKKSRGKKVCAIKRIKTERLVGQHFRRFLTEIEVMVQCRGPYYVTLLGFTGVRPYCIATEYLAKGALSRYCRERSDLRLTPTQLTIVALGVAVGLKHMHEKGIIHRDIKCSNVLLDNKMRPHICDFGVARFDSGDPYKSLTVGTTSYMAPEVMVDPNYTEMVDIYSYGMMLYEMAEYRKGVRCRDLRELYQMLVVRKEKPVFEKASPELKMLVLRLIEIDPERRMSAREIVSYIKNNAEKMFPGTNKGDVVEYYNWAKKKFEKQLKKDAAKGRSSSSSICHEFRRARPPENVQSQDSTDNSRQAPPPEQDVRRGEDRLNPASLYGVITDPLDPSFEKVVEDLANRIEPNDFLRRKDAFMQALNQAKNQNMMTLLMLVAGQMIKRNSYFVEMLEQEGFFKRMQITANRLSISVDLLMDVVQMNAIEINDYRQQFEVVLSIAPRKWIMLVDRLPECQCATKNPQAVLQFVHSQLESPPDALLQDPLSWRVVHVLTTLGSKCADYVKANIKTLAGVVSRFLTGSTTPETIMESYRFFDVCNCPFAEIPMGVMAQHLLRDDVYKCIYGLLAKVDAQDIVVNDQLIQGMLQRANDSDTWTILAKLASSASSRQYFLQNFAWLSSSTTPKEGMRVVMSLLRGGSTDTGSLCALREYAALLKSAVELPEDSEALAAVGIICMNGTISKDVMDVFSQEGLWSAYFNAIANTTDVAAKLYSARMVSKFTAVGYAPEFDDYVMQLTYMFAVSELVIPALVTLGDLSAYEQCALVLAQNDMPSYFTDYFMGNDYEPYAIRIMENMNNVL